MPSPLVLPTLTDALRALGQAHAYRTPWPLSLAVGAWVPIGQKEGDITVAFNEEVSELKAPELTGPAVHEVTVTGARPVVTMPLIMGDPANWPIFSPTGSSPGGNDFPQATVKHGLAIIPDSEIGGGLSFDGTTFIRTAGNGYAGASGAGAVPVNAFWFWRGIFRRPDSVPFTQNGGGKVVSTITFEALYDVTRNPAYRQWAIGDPRPAGPVFI